MRILETKPTVKVRKVSVELTERDLEVLQNAMALCRILEFQKHVSSPISQERNILYSEIDAAKAYLR